MYQNVISPFSNEMQRSLFCFFVFFFFFSEVLYNFTGRLSEPGGWDAGPEDEF